MATHRISALKQGATVIDGITNSRVSPGIELFLARSDGRYYNEFAAVKQQKPMVSFQCKKLYDILTLFGLGPVAISSTPLDLYTVEDDDGGTVKTTGEKVSCIKGLLVPKSLDLAQGQDASIEYEATLGSAAGTAPFSITSGQTVPTGMELDELFTIGAVTVNSSDIGPVKSVRFDFGYEIKVVFAGGIWPVLVCVKSCQPKITITTLKPTALAALGVSGTNNLVQIEALRCQQGGGRHTSGHQYFATHRNHVGVNSLTGSADADEMTTEFLVTPIFDGTNAPITWSGSAAPAATPTPTPSPASPTPTPT